MKQNTRWLRIASMLCLLLMMGMSANAGWVGFGGTSWKEEVLLHDGSKIVVERSQTRGGSHEIGQSPPVKEHDITFILPGSSKSITWNDEYSEVVGHSNFHLLALHILNSTPYIVVSPSNCLAYNKWGRPNPPYAIFKYDGKTWQRIALSEFPAELKEINLLIDTYGHYDVEQEIKSGFVSYESVTKLNGTLTQPEFKTILRERLANEWCPILNPSSKAPLPMKPKVTGSGP